MTENVAERTIGIPGIVNREIHDFYLLVYSTDICVSSWTEYTRYYILI
jgi:hypothetical protein